MEQVHRSHKAQRRLRRSAADTRVTHMKQHLLGGSAAITSGIRRGSFFFSCTGPSGCFSLRPQVRCNVAVFVSVAVVSVVVAAPDDIESCSRLPQNMEKLTAKARRPGPCVRYPRRVGREASTTCRGWPRSVLTPQPPNPLPVPQMLSPHPLDGLTAQACTT